MIVTVWKERKSGRVEMANVFMLTGFAMATMTATIKTTKKVVVKAKHFFRKHLNSELYDYIMLFLQNCSVSIPRCASKRYLLRVST